MIPQLYEFIKCIENFNFVESPCECENPTLKTLYYPNFKLRNIFNDSTELDTCSCGNKVFKSSMTYYPRFMVFLCQSCIKRIHFRVSAEYTLKLIGELRYRNIDIENIMDYIIPLKRVLGWLHFGYLNDKTSIIVLRTLLDTEGNICDIDIPYTKTYPSKKIKMGITDAQAKSLTSKKIISDFFEILAWNNFKIEEDFFNYGDMNLIRERQALDCVTELVKNSKIRNMKYG